MRLRNISAVSELISVLPGREGEWLRVSAPTGRNVVLPYRRREIPHFSGDRGVGVAVREAGKALERCCDRGIASNWSGG